MIPSANGLRLWVSPWRRAMVPKECGGPRVEHLVATVAPSRAQRKTVGIEIAIPMDEVRSMTPDAMSERLRSLARKATNYFNRPAPSE